jgi:hypothetical protein
MSLSAKDRVGSKIRCLDLSLMIKQDPNILIKLVDLEGVKVPSDPKIIPCGRGKPEELIFNKSIAENFVEELLKQNQGSSFNNYVDFKKKIEDWWLEHPKNANTPNWDIACIAEIHGRSGLILVEAKAHKSELSRETKKSYNTDSINSKQNHEKIMDQIKEASKELRSISGLDFNLNEHSPYQLSNRFAWSWFLAKNGIPVVLVYLGFIKANELEQKLFDSHEDFVNSVYEHCMGTKNDNTIYVPKEAWRNEPLFDIGKATMYSVIRSMEMMIGQSTVLSINGSSV